MLWAAFYDGVEIYREEKIVYAKCLKPHQVISTCRIAGGIRNDLSYIYNHQGCEPAGHAQKSGHHRAAADPEGYRRSVCARHGLTPETCATLGTAANMRLTWVETLSFRDLTVAAVVTGGVEANAGRAGDPAFGWEGPEGYEALSPEAGENVEPRPGTINTMLFLSLPLTPGALTRAIMTATEAKSAALQELSVNSRYSDGLATGTGTDQIAVAAAASAGRRPLTSAGQHSKLGELIGRAVKAAVKGVLIRQNGLTPDRQCSVKIHLERFAAPERGRVKLTTGALLDLVAGYLPPAEAELWRSNYRAIFHDPVNVAAVAALAHLKDKFVWGLLPLSVWGEVMAAAAAQVAAAVGGRYDLWPVYRENLAPRPGETDNGSFLNLAARALALGFRDKWDIE